MSEPAAVPTDGCEPGVDVPGEDAWDEDGAIARAREGDLEAFDDIMRRYEGRLLRFLTGLVGEVETARELCQDTFLSAYQALPRLRGEVRLNGWLHTIALNRARSYHRGRRLRLAVPLEEHHHPHSTDLQEGVARQDLVMRVLRRLPQQHAQPLLLQIVAGMTCREIGEALGCTEGAAKVRLLRARESFRQAYADEEAGR
ncbi:MAG TPA: RNA polymerase sigma factor [Chloroflexota bacterium]|nr:RNA polymerase sigma factor [Chloroflexota bacterium]